MYETSIYPAEPAWKNQAGSENLTRMNSVSLSLYARGTAAGEGLDLFQGRHGRIAGECGHQRAVCPAEVDSFLFRCVRQQAVEEARGKAIPAADPIVNIQFAGR